MHDRRVEIISMHGADDEETAPASSEKIGLGSWALLGLLAVGFLTVASFAIEGIAYTVTEVKEALNPPSPAQYVATYFHECGSACKESLIWKSTGEYDIRIPIDHTIFETVFGCTGNPCIIEDSLGGDRNTFAMAGLAARAHPTIAFVINHKCSSACVTFADIARERVCLGPQAVMRVHQGYTEGQLVSAGVYRTKWDGARYTPTLSPDITELVEAKGGFPTKGLLDLPASEVEHIWPQCTRHSAPSSSQQSLMWAAPAKNSPWPVPLMPRR